MSLNVRLSMGEPPTIKVTDQTIPPAFRPGPR